MEKIKRIEFENITSSPLLLPITFYTGREDQRMYMLEENVLDAPLWKKDQEKHLLNAKSFRLRDTSF